MKSTLTNRRNKHTDKVAHNVWQWICRGLGTKKELLEHHIASSNTKPAAICIQEPGRTVTRQGYQKITNTTRVATYVRNDIATTLPHLETNHPVPPLTELLPLL